MSKKRRKPQFNIIQILPDRYDFTDDDPVWDDVIVPLEFKPHIDKSLVQPVIQTGIPRDYSFVLFGPPGTGKTTIVKSIAKQLGWDFYNIGPQHFVKSEISIEEAMKTCMENIRNLVTKKRSNGKKVFFFDEIDELVISRDDGADRQSRLSTTIMLPLIQDLRDLAKKHNFVFFVATNHIERFDSAIIRRGRFDVILPLGPPDRAGRFLLFHKFIDKIREEYLKKYHIELKTEFDRLSGNEKIREVTADLDIISRTSARLSLKDIEAVCKNVAEHQVARFPSLLNKSVKTELYLETNYFIDWIYKFRHQTNKDDIENFYRDRDRYARGSALYTKSNTLQEKVKHEFDSLHVEHNLNEIGSNWKKNSTYKVEFSFWNLSGLSPFKGQISLFARMNRRTLAHTVGHTNEDVQQGRVSHKYSLKIKPTRTGVLHLLFVIDGSFEMLGIERSLLRNKANLSGIAIKSRDIKIS